MRNGKSVLVSNGRTNFVKLNNLKVLNDLKLISLLLVIDSNLVDKFFPSKSKTSKRSKSNPLEPVHAPK